MKEEIKIIPKKETRSMRRKINALARASYPDFVLWENATLQYWDKIYSDFIDYQIIFYAGQKLAAIVNSIPVFVPDKTISLPDEGWDWALATGCNQHDEKIKPNTLIGLSIVVAPEMRGAGLGKLCLLEFKNLAKRKNLKKAYIPVRPTKKADFPKIPFGKYINKKADGKYLDPWLNLHYRSGGKFIGICRKSMRTETDIKTWESWTGKKFAKSGKYEIKGALSKIIINKKNDKGIYLEPNVWIEHTV